MDYHVVTGYAQSGCSRQLGVQQSEPVYSTSSLTLVLYYKRRMMRRARHMSELLRDERFAFHVGQLMGAAEMAAHWMQIQEDPMTKNMGARLAQSVSWFFTDDVKAGPGKVV